MPGSGIALLIQLRSHMGILYETCRVACSLVE